MDLNYGAIFDAKILSESSDCKTYHWNNLELEIFQRTDSVMVTKIRFDNIIREDLMKLSELFRDLAGQCK